MTWRDYVEKVKASDPELKKELEQIEALADIVGPIISKRSELGLSQRELAEKCEIPQSSIARIESGKTTPKIDTLQKILKALDLELIIQPATR